MKIKEYVRFKLVELVGKFEAETAPVQDPANDGDVILLVEDGIESRAISRFREEQKEISERSYWEQVGTSPAAPSDERTSNDKQAS